MKTYTIKLLSVIALLGIAIHTYAQEETNVNREMTLEREYNPSVQDANKINTLPTVKEPEIRKIPIDYSSYTIPINPEKEVSILPSGRVQTDIAYNKRRGYFNFAGGTLMNLNGDFGYHILSTDKDQLNFYLSHRSTNGKIKYLQIDEKVKAKLNDNLVGLNYRHIFDNAIFKIGGKFNHSAFNYYGFPVSADKIDISTADRNTKQKAQTINFYTGVSSHEDATIGYLLDAGYTNFSYKYGAGKAADGPTEHTFDLKGDLNTEFSSDQRFGIGAGLRYFNYSLPSFQSRPNGIGEYSIAMDNYAEILVSPYYRITGDSWKVQLGANLIYITGDNDKFMITPNVDITAEVAERTEFYVSATGKVQSNSLHDVAHINRYTNPTERTLPTQHWLNSVIGIKSGIVPGFWFDVFGGYNIMNNDLVFAPRLGYYDDDFGNVSQPIRMLDTKQFFIGAGLKYSYQQYFDFNLKGVFNNWDMKHEGLDESLNENLPSFGRPKVEFTAGLTLRPIKNAAIALDYYLGTDRTTLLNNGVIDLDNINELNATASYTFNDTFGAYVKLNNLLFQKYEWHYGYPMQKFSAMVGINLNF